ncbi:hypothetical protein GCM10017667_67620 [Streptomyces filamentosus]|uniref:Uncharacterized protein n=1 Tax=Streptomyces filamentosus TaxID=67294 RepID=A0A919ER57_STRFL|nr:hypothetical protein GCM10017667_67620 [Streptomyces filamentosus]
MQVRVVHPRLEDLDPVVSGRRLWFRDLREPEDLRAAVAGHSDSSHFLTSQRFKIIRRNCATRNLNELRHAQIPETLNHP